MYKIGKIETDYSDTTMPARLGQLSCLFFSSFSILLIAVDRYRIIVQPTSPEISVKMVSPLETLLY